MFYFVLLIFGGLLFVLFHSIYIDKSFDRWLKKMDDANVFKRKVMRLEYEQHKKRLAVNEHFYLPKFELSNKLPSHADMVKSGKPWELESYFNKEEIEYFTDGL